MKQSVLLILAILLAGTAAGAAPLAREQREATLKYVASLQNSDGGFRTSAPASASQLGALVSGLRALRYLGHPADRRQKDAALRFIRSCEHQNPAAFSDKPGGEPAVISSALGIMALAECRGSGDAPERAYLEQNAHTLPELYMAEASMDAAHLRPRVASRWIDFFRGLENPDGSYGKGAFDTATAVITLLRLGAPVKDREAAARILEGAQQPDGGFAPAGASSDLPTTYRMMRALYMLKATPSLTRLRGFIERCRNADGGYGPSPGQPSSVSATYNAAIVMHWAEELEHAR